jgi:hypothetical protein
VPADMQLEGGDAWPLTDNCSHQHQLNSYYSSAFAMPSVQCSRSCDNDTGLSAELTNALNECFQRDNGQPLLLRACDEALNWRDNKAFWREQEQGQPGSD